MLRWLMALLLGWWMVRLFRRVAAVPAPPSSDTSPKRSLDPERAVEASWSEVEEEGPDT